MNRKAGIVIVVLAIVLGVVFFLTRSTPRSATSPTSAPVVSENPNANPSAPDIQSGLTATSTPPATAASVAATPNPAAAGIFVSPPAPDTSGIPPAVVMQNVRRAVRQYGDMFKGNPVGTNPEITAALAGKNPKGINFINADAGMRVNDQGEMIDSWGTPYFFHQISGTDMEIHSAGPDRVMWTGDDLVTK